MPDNKRITEDKSNDSTIKVSTPDVLKDKPVNPGDSSKTDRNIDNLQDTKQPLRK